MAEVSSLQEVINLIEIDLKISLWTDKQKLPEAKVKTRIEITPRLNFKEVAF